jgi:Ca2+-binding EF-hand superfamily protein
MLFLCRGFEAARKLIRVFDKDGNGQIQFYEVRVD